jgi:hypothetical protein
MNCNSMQVKNLFKRDLKEIFTGILIGVCGELKVPAGEFRDSELGGKQQCKRRGSDFAQNEGKALRWFKKIFKPAGMRLEAKRKSYDF